MQVISLFSGIGGFELAARSLGWDNVVSCEINPFGRRVLEYHFPESYHHDDIHTLNYEKIKEKSRWNPNEPTIVVGGFPCQPYSLAGKRLGKEDDRHLFPEMLRIIREVKPEWVVGENVFGLVNWNGGLVFNEVQADLEAEGYEVQAYVLPAVSVNAPHRRDRVWFVAHRQTNRQSSTDSINKRKEYQSNNGSGIWNTSDTNGSIGITTNSDSIRQHGCISQYEEQSGEGRQYAQRNIGESINNGHITNPNNEGWQQYRTQPFAEGEEPISPRHSQCLRGNAWENFPTQPPIRGGNDGIPNELDSITLSKWRQEAIKAYGNAIVPQVALQIFKAIQEYENNFHS